MTTTTNLDFIKDDDFVLVTGGSGLVGEGLRREIAGKQNQNKFIFLSSKDADLTDHPQARKMFEMFKPTYVINLAAKVGGLYANITDNDLFYHVNSDINQNVLALSNEYDVKKCISCLSTCIFPDKIDYPLDETKIHLGPPHSSNVGYSLAKRQVDILNRKYNKIARNKSLFTSIVPTNIYGHYDNFNLEQSHVVPGLIHRAYLSIQQAEKDGLTCATLRVSGSGRPLRQFIYAQDLAKLLLWVLENYEDSEPLIISPNEDDELSISYIAEKICEIFSKKFNVTLKVEYDLDKEDGQYRKTASNRKLRKLCPAFVFTKFDDGINEVINWFCENYQYVRK